MTVAEFEVILNRRISLIREVLVHKATEYATDADLLHNFKRSAEVTPGLTPAQHCLGFATKHWASLCDIVDDVANGKKLNLPVLSEKIGDAVNYLILLEALLTEEK